MGFIKTVKIWKCDNCGKEESWTKTWMARVILHKSGGPGPWDEELTVCCQQCANELDEKRKIKRKRSGK
jgi:hypothetical protein